MTKKQQQQQTIAPTNSIQKKNLVFGLLGVKNFKSWRFKPFKIQQHIDRIGERSDRIEAPQKQ